MLSGPIQRRIRVVLVVHGGDPRQLLLRLARVLRVPHAKGEVANAERMEDREREGVLSDGELGVEGDGSFLGIAA